MTNALDDVWDKAQALGATQGPQTPDTDPSSGWHQRARTTVQMMAAADLPTTFAEAEAALRAMGHDGAAHFLATCVPSEHPPEAYRRSDKDTALQQYRYPLY